MYAEIGKRMPLRRTGQDAVASLTGTMEPRRRSHSLDSLEVFRGKVIKGIVHHPQAHRKMGRVIGNGEQVTV